MFPSHPLASNVLSSLLFRQVALVALALLPVLAMGGCADVITYSKDSRRAGVQQFTEGRYEDAAGSFRNAIRQDPRDFRSHYYLGASYDAMGAQQQAIHSYQSALETLELSLVSREEEGHQFRHQIIDGLAKSIAKGQQRATDVALPQRGRRPAEDALLGAKVARYSGDADAAVEAYTQAYNLDPQDFYTAKEAGLYFEELGQVQQANAVLRQAFAINPQDAQVGSALRRLGVVPGPSLKDRRDLADPAVPKGPIPPVNEWNLGLNRNQSAPPPPAADPGYAPAPVTGGTVQAPRD